jgi:AcrR family transcriptional regulator
MLEAASEMIEGSGLTVSLDHISFEEVIQRAGVSRSAAYRRWPYKDLFFTDLLRQLAGASRPTAAYALAGSPAAVARLALSQLGQAATAGGRRDIVLELIRQAGLGEFEITNRSPEWRTYIALHATFLSVSDEGLRGDLEAALGASERGFIGSVAASWEQLSDLFGYRLRSEFGATFEDLARLLVVTLRGLVMMAPSTPELGSRRMRAAPFGTEQEREWSLPALLMASIAFTFLEPDPEVVWDLEHARQAQGTFELLASSGDREDQELHLGSRRASRDREGRG